MNQYKRIKGRNEGRKEGREEMKKERRVRSREEVSEVKVLSKCYND